MNIFGFPRSRAWVRGLGIHDLLREFSQEMPVGDWGGQDEKDWQARVWPHGVSLAQKLHSRVILSWGKDAALWFWFQAVIGSPWVGEDVEVGQGRSPLLDDMTPVSKAFLWEGRHLWPVISQYSSWAWVHDPGSRDPYTEQNSYTPVRPRDMPDPRN